MSVLRLTLALLAAVAALAVAACGNDEQNSYVDDVNAAQNEFLDSMTQAASQPPPTNAQQANALVSSMEDSLNAFADDLEGIEPPEDVADLHQELITTTTDVADEIGKLGKALQSGDPRRAAQAATQLSTVVTSAQGKFTSLIDQINTKLGD